MVVTVPHFDLPLRYVGGQAQVVQQDSLRDVQNCAEAAVRTVVGTRPWVPNFGIDDDTFENQPLDLNVLSKQITTSEPRALVTLSQFDLSYDNIVDYILMGVSSA